MQPAFAQSWNRPFTREQFAILSASFGDNAMPCLEHTQNSHPILYMWMMCVKSELINDGIYLFICTYVWVYKFPQSQGELLQMEAIFMNTENLKKARILLSFLFLMDCVCVDMCVSLCTFKHYKVSIRSLYVGYMNY